MAVTIFPTPSTGGAAQTQKTDIITTTGTWTSPAGVTRVDVILVGGGGAGGGVIGWNNGSAGGGGGGGVLIQTLAISPSTAYTITIGAGGARSTGGADGGTGGNTTFGSLATAFGGGGGRGVNTFGNPLATGGSGGGESNDASGAFGGGGGGFVPAGGTQDLLGGAALQGNPGKTSSNVRQWQGLGGQAYLNAYGGGGGGGSATASSSVSAYQTGGANAGRGARGGTPGTAGVANFGGGGGGGTNTQFAENGGSGVAIIRYWS